ncbi:MAG: glycerophosphodiester phosphodiesterase family protein [Verrucomicrobiota bacterium]
MAPSRHPVTAAAFAVSLLLAGSAAAASGLFRFNNAADRLAAASGTATMTYFDPEGSEWWRTATRFGKASSFGLPAMTGGDPDVMLFPASTAQQGYQVTTNFAPNGSFTDSLTLTSNYTLVYDLYFPAESGGKWRGLFQTNTGNTDDGEFFLQNSATGGVGINSNYAGVVSTGAWHRIAISVRAAPKEGQAQRYVDGQFVGAVGTTGSGLEERFGFANDILLLTDDDKETATGYLSSFYIVDRAMNAAEITALGGPNAAGANVPGPAAPAYTAKMPRFAGALGHRGGDFGSYPDNTIPAIRQAFLEGAAGVEIDTRLTADGHAVCFHDETVDRTTNGIGSVADFTLADLKLLDAGVRYDPAFTGTRVPSLTEALTEAKGKGIVYLDIKTEGQAAAFAAAIAASGFPVSDLWFWTPDNADYAARIRAAVTDAKILWGEPDPDWASIPGYFQGLRDMGVFGFSCSSGVEHPIDRNFIASAKKEGFVVEIYTINDPEAMLYWATAGVDYMETDFPATTAALQPARLAKASSPNPPAGGTIASASGILSWVTGTGATKHRVHFGTVNPPPLVSEQTSDLYQTGILAQSQTYYWKVDGVTSGDVIVSGDVWSFTTPAPATGTILEWEFSGSLAASMGSGVLTFADGVNTRNQTAFETTDGANVPHIGGVPATFIRIPKFASIDDGLALTFPAAIAPNGGGAKVNRYSFVFDMLLSSVGEFTSFFNTKPANDDDGDFFINRSGALGVGALGYSPGNGIQSGVWQRVIFSADLPSGNVNYYIDGVPVKSRAGVSLTDDRFALVPGTAAGPQVRLLNDNDGEMSEILINSIAFIDAPLTPAQAAEFGAPQSAGIFYKGSMTLPPVTIARTGNSITLTWTAAAGRRLQRSTTLSGWTDVPGTTGQGTHTEIIQSGSKVFFRAAE